MHHENGYSMIQVDFSKWVIQLHSLTILDYLYVAAIRRIYWTNPVRGRYRCSPGLWNLDGRGDLWVVVWMNFRSMR